jgi:lipoprotein-anchoring transpeptidase ErfK/SrfK
MEDQIVHTIKTAAIFIFVGTVVWGAYTSLTTPPETLPEDVQELIFDHEPAIAFDEESFDAGLADSLPELDINSGELTDDIGTEVIVASVDTNPQFGADLPLDAEAPPAAFSEHPSQPIADSAVTARLSDTPPSVQPRQYASTTQTFDLPDPSSIAPNFQSAGIKPSSAQPDRGLALASGTSNSNPGSPPTQADIANNVIQASPASAPNVGITNAIRTADQQYAEDQRKEALATLSIFYNIPNLSGEDRASLLSRLDPLAREVIYSKQHLLEKPYRVGQQESLVDIAAKYEVPWQLLANINQVTDPMTLLPGTELKVVTGPFRAEVDLSQQELTLFLGDLYAGRFPIAVGSDPAPKPGTFTIQDKQTDHTYYNQAGAPVPAGSDANPYGSAWIDLGGQVCVHGSPDKRKPTNKGCISLADDLATDLYGILSQGSSVTIRR